jgi:FkbM family methyltransferase
VLGAVVTRTIRGSLRALGYDIVRYYEPTSYFDQRRDLVRTVDVVLDVGANIGQYALEVRLAGFQGRIISFEPLAAPFAELCRRARHDDRWVCRRVALGDADGNQRMHVARNTWSSSLLDIEVRAVAAVPDSAYVRTEDVQTSKLDSLQEELLGDTDRVFLKLDVQGLELKVLRGAQRFLRQVHAIESELSVASLYRGQPLITDMLQELRHCGFELIAMNPTFFDPANGELLQLDALFRRK